MRNAHWVLVVLLFSTGCGEEAAETDAAEGDGGKSVAEIRTKSDEVSGLFTLLQNRKDGTLQLLLQPSQLGQEFIYHIHVVDGVAGLGLFRGNYGRGKVLQLRRHFDRIEIVERNTSFYFDPEHPLYRARSANISEAVLAVEKIEAEDDDGIIISLDSVLLKEQLAQIKPTPNPDVKPTDRFMLGKLSDSRSKIVSAKSYPQNTEVVVEYVYGNPAPAVQGGADVTDSRAVSIQVQHSFIAMPNNNYEARRDDYRVGYFTDRVTDLTATSHTPYRDLINRWNLQKQDPDAFVSDPVEPITFWIENTTPLEFRDTIREAALAWNSSFEKAGISNALAVRVQPDDATWDAGDIRYNVLRWTSSPNPPFGGMGPSFSNPRTGQILGADIMLEYSFVSNYAKTQEVLQPSAMSFTSSAHCVLASAMQSNYQFASLALDIQGVDASLEEQLLKDALSMLILHEIGHTLGLNHNMKASHFTDDPFDPAGVSADGLSASVMDYEAVNVAPPGRAQTWFFQSRPGPYDDWAIEFGYSQAVLGEIAERARLEALLARSGEPQHVFGNDADDMRSPGYGIDPRVNIWDMSGDAIGYARMRIEHLKTIHTSMLDRYDGYTSWQPLSNGHRTLVNQWAQAARVIASYIGGVYVERLPPGSDRVPYLPVSLAEQKRAMQVLRDLVFVDTVFDASAVFSRLQPQRRGFDFLGAPEDPKLHRSILAAQRLVLNYLLHPRALQRMTDSRLYGNEYDVATMLSDLSDAIFEADLKGDVTTRRQNLQIEYAMRLAGMLRGGTRVDHVGRSAVHFQLERIQAWMKKKRGGNIETRAHTGHVIFIVEQALSVEA